LIFKNRHYESIQNYRNKVIVNLEIANQRVERWEHEMWKNLVGSSGGVDLFFLMSQLFILRGEGAKCYMLFSCQSFLDS